jgi:hypothetical protein
MASKRTREPLNVREPIARYSVRRGPCAMTARVLQANSRAAAPPHCACSGRSSPCTGPGDAHPALRGSVSAAPFESD